MNDNILDVLMYLFENYMDDDLAFNQDEETLVLRLVEAGFAQAEVRKAFAWLTTLMQTRLPVGPVPEGGHPTRVYHPDELGKLNSTARGFIMSMEQSGILTPETRELVIERVLMLDTHDVTVEQLKWVMLMVLFNQPEDGTNISWFEDLELDNTEDALH